MLLLCYGELFSICVIIYTVVGVLCLFCYFRICLFFVFVVLFVFVLLFIISDWTFWSLWILLSASSYHVRSCGLSHTWSSRRLYFFTLNFNLTAASIENVLQKVGGIAALLQLCKIHQRLIYRVNVLICSGCYLLYIASSDVLKDKFHTKVDKLTRFFLCCCFTHGHGSLIPTRGAGELAVCLCLPAHFMFLSLRCDTLSSQNLFFPPFFCVCTHIPHRLEKWL